MMLHKLKHRIVNWLFQKWFRGYHYPFLSSDAKLMNLIEVKRQAYYESAREVSENSAFKQELEELTRQYYRHIACSSTISCEMTAYRVTLKFIQDLEARFVYLGSKTKEGRAKEIEI